MFGEQHMKPIVFLIVGLGIGMLLCSCADYRSTVSFAPVKEEYARQTSQLSAGMSKEQLQKLFPDIHVAYHKWTRNVYCEVLETEHTMLGNSPNGFTGQVLWLYMLNGRLVEWGDADMGARIRDWQKNAGQCPCAIDRAVAGEAGRPSALRD
jgi:hypothetical protein